MNSVNFSVVSRNAFGMIQSLNSNASKSTFTVCVGVDCAFCALSFQLIVPLRFRLLLLWFNSFYARANVLSAFWIQRQTGHHVVIGHVRLAPVLFLTIRWTSPETVFAPSSSFLCDIRESVLVPGVCAQSLLWGVTLRWKVYTSVCCVFPPQIFYLFMF